jgi:hypothetical protein
LEFENYVVLMVVQAMLGMVSEVIRGVAVEVKSADSVEVHFAVIRMDPTIEEHIDDIVTDVEGLLWPKDVGVTSKAFVGSARDAWEGRQHRMVYLAQMEADTRWM